MFTLEVLCLSSRRFTVLVNVVGERKKKLLYKNNTIIIYKIYIMFESLQRIYSQLKSFLQYFTCKISLKREEPYYEVLPEDDIQHIFL